MSHQAFEIKLKILLFYKKESKNSNIYKIHRTIKIMGLMKTKTKIVKITPIKILKNILVHILLIIFKILDYLSDWHQIF